MSTRNCPSCGAPIALNATECRYCGEKIAVAQPQQQAPHQYIHQQASQYVPPQAPQYTSPQAPQYAQQQNVQYSQQNVPNQTQLPYTHTIIVSTKSRVAAAILAILFGGIGLHKFYLGKIKQGILYFLFAWTYIPVIIVIIEGIIYLTSSDEKFYLKYVKK